MGEGGSGPVKSTSRVSPFPHHPSHLLSFNFPNAVPAWSSFGPNFPSPVGGANITFCSSADMCACFEQ